jgi:hypothetical protein
MLGRIIFLVLILVQTVCFGQRFKGGFTIGLDATDVNGADTRDTDNDFSKLGFTAGGIISTSLSPKTVFQVEFNYIQKGHLDKPDSMNNGYSKIALQYVEIPFLIKHRVNFTIRKKQVSRLDLEAGASIGRLVNYSIIGASNYKIYSGPELFNFYDASILVGADYNLSRNVCFSLRYSNSVIPVIKKNAANVKLLTNTFNKGNNMVFQFAFKFLFGGPKPEETPPVPVEVGEGGG